VKRLLVLAAGAYAVAALAAGSAGAANECEGLDVCISVSGPWVVVPAPARADGVRRVEYQLSCPRGAIAAGLDAVLRDPTLEVTFLGRLGSPIAPGVTTGRSVVFVAMWTGDGPTAFRPFLGCIPTSGGGRENTAVAPRPPERTVRTVRLRAGSGRQFLVRCGVGRRLEASSHAVGIRQRAEPSAAMLTAVRVARRQVNGHVSVRAQRSGAIPARVRVDVQVHALCGRF
jgi:hypothetical protein